MSGWQDKVGSLENDSMVKMKKRLKEKRAKKKKTYIVGSWNDLYFEWIKGWEKVFSSVVMPRWGVKEKSQAKILIEKVGVDNSIATVRYLFANWDSISKNVKRKDGIPSIGLLLVCYERFYIKAIEEYDKEEEVDKIIEGMKIDE